ncbi:TPA: hypothetical protein ACH3X1_016232 [Trebouxia sp. C0004]
MAKFKQPEKFAERVGEIDEEQQEALLGVDGDEEFVPAYEMQDVLDSDAEEYFQQVARLSGWNENKPIALAELHMLDKAQSWSVGLDRTTLTSFDTLARLMIERFGSKTTLMTRLDHRKQEANETVWDYVDAMRLLLAKTSYPAEGNRVQNNMPRNMDNAVEIALYFEDLDIGSSPEKAMATEKRCSTDREMARLTDRFDKLGLSLTEAVKYGRRDSNGGRGHQSILHSSMVCVSTVNRQGTSPLTVSSSGERHLNL